MIFRPALITLVLVSALGIPACGKLTLYQPATDEHGYAEQQLEENRYRVTFSGNSLTSRETVENYLLFRSAQITLECGYDCFVVVEKDIERSVTHHLSVTGFGGHHGFHSFHHPHGFGGFGSTTTWPRISYTALANIVMRKGDKPSENSHAYDARELVTRLESTVRRPTT